MFLSLLFVIINITNSQCEINFPAGDWESETVIHSGETIQKDISISLDENSLEISDFTGGFFDHFGFPGNYSLILSLNCNGSIESASLNTDTVGDVLVESGTWNEGTQTLTINWSIPSNGISESTKFSLK